MLQIGDYIHNTETREEGFVIHISDLRSLARPRLSWVRLHTNQWMICHTDTLQGIYVPTRAWQTNGLFSLLCVEEPSVDNSMSIQVNP